MTQTITYFSKRKHKILFFISLISSLLCNNYLFSSMFPNVYQYAISKTELKTRNLQWYGMPLVDAQMNMPLLKEECPERKSCFAFYLIGIAAHSLNTSNFGDYFSINQNSRMIVKGDDAPEIENRNIRAEYIGGSNTTDLTLSLQGKQDLTGAKFLFQFSLEQLLKHCFFHNWFLSIRGAFTHETQKLSLQANDNKNNNNDFSSINTFFSKTTNNARIDSCPHSENGLENVTITLDGIYTSAHNTAEIYYYTGIEIPTTFEYNVSQNLFYPTIGNNGNIGIIAGGDFHLFMYESAKQRVGFLLEIENHFLLYKTVIRTFDLYQNKYSNGTDQEQNINKPWSRYLPAYDLYNTQTNQTVSGPSNLPVRIHPCNNLDVSAGILYDLFMKSGSHWVLALGYNLWMSQPEYIELQDRVYPKEYKNFYQYDILGSLPNKTSSKSTISNQAPNDITNQHFDFLSLDYGSCASDGGYSNSIFFRASLFGYSGVSCLIGGFYEIGKNKTIPSRMGGWVGFGLEY